MNIQTNQQSHCENLIREGVPVIFLERPWSVLKASFHENVSFCQRFKLLIRAIRALVHAIFTWDLTFHSGILIRQEGRIYRIHMTASEAVKHVVPNYFLKGCDLLVPNDDKIQEKFKEVMTASEMEMKENAVKSVYSMVTNFCETASSRRYKLDYCGMLSILCNRQRDLTLPTSYFRQYFFHKGDPSSNPKFLCTELVATAWMRAGIRIADEKYRINKILMSDIKKYAVASGLFTLSKI